MHKISKICISITTSKFVYIYFKVKYYHGLVYNTECWGSLAPECLTRNHNSKGWSL